MSTATKQTPFEYALQQAEAGLLVTPSVSVEGKPVGYFNYQLNVHLFNLKIMASGMKCRGITFTQIKKYYGLQGKSAKDCVPQMQDVILKYATRSLTN